MITDRAKIQFVHREHAHNGTEPDCFIGIMTGYDAHVLKTMCMPCYLRVNGYKVDDKCFLWRRGGAASRLSALAKPQVFNSADVHVHETQSQLPPRLK